MEMSMILLYRRMVAVLLLHIILAHLPQDTSELRMISGHQNHMGMLIGDLCRLMKAPATQKDVCLLHREVHVVPFQSISRGPPEPNTMSRSTKRPSAEFRYLPAVPILEDPTR